LQHPAPTSAHEIIATLAKIWPRCFSVFERRRRPLAIGIRNAILASGITGIDEAMLAIALGTYTSNSGYLASLQAGAPRIGLDGTAAGTVTAGEVGFAEQRLARLKKKRPPAPKREPGNLGEISPRSAKREIPRGPSEIKPSPQRVHPRPDAVALRLSLEGLRAAGRARAQRKAAAS
jgi:ProP effector